MKLQQTENYKKLEITAKKKQKADDPYHHHLHHHLGAIFSWF